jgi:hypothetical protein
VQPRSKSVRISAFTASSPFAWFGLAIVGILLGCGSGVRVPGTQASQIAAGATTAPSVPATQLVFLGQPASTSAGLNIGSGISVAIEDASGNIVTTTPAAVSLSIAAPNGSVGLAGTTIVTSINGVTTFDDLTVNTVGQNYQLVASSAGFTSAISAAFSITPASNGSVFTLPAANQCDSTYDHFYETEPGVFAYWPLCETSTGGIGYDYLGQWPLAGGFGTNNAIVGGITSPIPDGETAAQVTDASYKLENEGITLNKNAGTIATWVNADAQGYAVAAEYLAAHTSGGFNGSNLSIKVVRSGSSLCFVGELTNSSAEPFTAEQCGYTPNTWHRVAMTWSSGTISLYIDGLFSTSTAYNGTLDDATFAYQLFPGCCVTGKQMSLAKALVANEAWNAAQVALDYGPAIAAVPAGGVYVTADPLGTIHKDVLGYADDNQNISTTALQSSLNDGLATGGFSSVRYAGGFGGIQADAGDWQHGPVECTQTAGKTDTAQNIATSNNVDTYLPEIATAHGLSVGYTVNYGSNPPECNAGGDPITNGANLVQYANITKGYGIKYWEIGNEQFAYGGNLIDLHPNPYLNGGSSLSTYPQYEPGFYDAMKAVDPAIQVAVPATVTTSYNAMANYEYPVLLGAKYDAVAFHAYPVQDPISDGATLYQDRIAAGTQIRGKLLAMQTQLLNAGKSKDALWVTEWDGSTSQGKWSKQSMGAVEPLFVVAQLAEFMQAGVQYATWWEQGMTDVCSTYNFDNTAASSYNWWSGCGDLSPVYTGTVAGVGEESVGMKPGDLTPPGRGFQVLSQSGFVAEGEHMLHTYTDSQGAPWLEAYGATHGTSYAVILINRDRDAAHTVPVSLAGQTRGSKVTQWTYGRAQYDETYFGDWSVGPVTSTEGSWTGSFSAVLPPWSVTVLVFQN